MRKEKKSKAFGIWILFLLLFLIIGILLLCLGIQNPSLYFPYGTQESSVIWNFNSLKSFYFI